VGSIGLPDRSSIEEKIFPTNKDEFAEPNA